VQQQKSRRFIRQLETTSDNLATNRSDVALPSQTDQTQGRKIVENDSNKLISIKPKKSIARTNIPSPLRSTSVSP